MALAIFKVTAALFAIIVTAMIKSVIIPLIKTMMKPVMMALYARGSPLVRFYEGFHGTALTNAANMVVLLYL